jgi:peroxiredoxin
MMSTYPVMPERPLEVGDLAPDFDLSSTEDVLLMLKDEVPRTPVLLYVFAGAQDEQARADLAEIERRRTALLERRAKILAVSPSPLGELKKLQADLRLQFPLLADDRGFTKGYGLDGAEGKAASPALYLIGRDLRVLWCERPVMAVGSALAAVEKLLAGQPSSAAGYPRRVINRWIDRWVH